MPRTSLSLPRQFFRHRQRSLSAVRKRIRNIREKALMAYAERRKPKPQRKPMTAEERRAVWNTLKYVNK